MKRIVFLLITVTLLSGLSACKPKRGAVQNEDGKINVTVTIFPPYDFVRQIAGDAVNLNMLLPPGSESHSFEPSPRDIITIQNSDIFIYAGGESDKWIDRILESMDTSNMAVFAMISAVEAVQEEVVEGMEDDDDETSYDEHVWTDPLNAVILVLEIADLLCEADPDNADIYMDNADAYIEELLKLVDAYEELVIGAKRRTIVFADRFPFRYLADAYHLNYFAAFPGCSTETEPSAATVAFLINKIRQEQIPVVFHIELGNERMANTISGETGAKKMLLHSAHNISKQDFDAGLGYLEIMQRNIESLKDALY